MTHTHPKKSSFIVPERRKPGRWNSGNETGTTEDGKRLKAKYNLQSWSTQRKIDNVMFNELPLLRF